MERISADKSPIIEQAIFDQEELEALVEVAKQKLRRAETEQVCKEYFWLASVHPLLEKQDLSYIVTAVRMVVAAFLAK